jgi:hypothetical protein
MSNTKRCFCIDAKNEDMNAIIKQLKIEEPEESKVVTSVEPDYKFLLTPHIGKINDRDEKVLDLIDDLMTDAIKKLDNYDDVIPSNTKIENGIRNSLTTNTNDDDDIDLNKMASTDNVNYRGVDNMGIFEDFNCDNKCSTRPNKELPLFETVEAKYLLFIIALLFLCSIICRK